VQAVQRGQSRMSVHALHCGRHKGVRSGIPLHGPDRYPSF